MAEQNWNERYQVGDIPWENGNPHPEIKRLFTTYAPVGSSVLEIGCGIGTNAKWLATAGYLVTAIDIAPEAIKRGTENSKNNNFNIEYKTLDFLKEVDQLGRYSFVLDCAVFHIMQDLSSRMEFVKRVAQVCQDNGMWINISCSTDQTKNITKTTSVKAPSSLSLQDMVGAVEAYFEILEVKHCGFNIDRIGQGSAVFNAWASVFKRR